MQLRSSIRAQLNLNGSRHETSGTADNKSSFLNLPPEIHLLIFEHLGFPPISSINVAQFPTWAALELTCKAAQAITEPYLYHKIYTNVRDTYAHSGQLRPLAARKRRFDTRSLVKLLRRRSHLVKFVKFLIIDEYDPRALRQLLANDFVKLESLIVQQDDKVLRHVGRKTCERWNHTAKRQAKLKNFVFFIAQDERSHTMYPLAVADATLFNNPSLTRIRLSWVCITPFEDLPEDHLYHPSLEELNIERCGFTLASLSRLIHRSTRLTTLRMHCVDFTPLSAVDEADFIPTLEAFAGNSLKILDLTWPDLIPKDEEWTGWDLSRFTALRHLNVSPFFLFGVDAYTLDSPPEDLVTLLRRSLPPRVKLLGFDSMMPRNPVPTPPPGFGLDLPDISHYLLRTLIRFMGQDNFVPYLTRIFVFYCEYLARIPQELIECAYQKGARLGFMHQVDHKELAVITHEWLDEDGNDDVREHNREREEE